MQEKVKKILKKRSVLVGAAIVVAAGLYFVFTQHSAPVEQVFTVEASDFEETVAVSGTVVAAQDSDLGFSESGRVAQIYASVGDRVSAGSILAAIENAELVATVAQKEAALEGEKAKLRSLMQGTRPEQIAINRTTVLQKEEALRDAIRSGYVAGDDAVRKKVDQFLNNPLSTSVTLSFLITDAGLKNRIEQGRIALEVVLANWSKTLTSPTFASTDPESASKLAKQHLTQVAVFLSDASAALALASPQNTTYQTDVATARTAVTNALTELSNTESALLLARGELALSEAGATKADIEAQAAQVKAAEANVLSAKAQLAKTYVVAPFAGIVSRMDIKKGEIVSVSSSPIALLSTGAFHIETFVPQISVVAVSVGDPATVTLDAYGSQVSFTARVLSVDPAETTRDGIATYKTKLVFDTVDPRIRSGMSANIAIITDEKSGAIIIPSGAVLRTEAGAFVRVQGEETPRAVTLGLPVALGRVEVLSGLTDGDVILLAP
jgi:HlyD family secretion protein